ncbi:hypothetical protein ACGFXC_22390 [Streptomyces sp. NPDC048507]|uniref:hypothetical protein n=1 Tax=Streptomyces sp. NPDC048507 TaxID=3365560 RepID=UPI00370FBEDF
MSDTRQRAPMRATRAAMFAAVCVVLAAVGHSSMSGMNIPFGWLLGAFAVTAGLAWPATGRRCGPVGISAALLGVQAALHLAFSASGAHARMPGARGPGHHHTGPAAPAAPAASEAHGMPAHGTPGTAAHGTAGMDAVAGSAAQGAADAHAVADTAAHGVTGAADAAAYAASGMADMAGDGAAGPAGLLAMAGHGGFGMIAAHVLAGLFCAAWLAWGEAAVFRLAGALGATALLAARPLARALALVRTRVVPVPAPPAHRPPYVRPRRLRGAVHAHTAVRRGPPGARPVRATAPGRPARA